MPNIRILRVSCLALLSLAGIGAHAADAPYPTKPIRFILGYLHNRLDQIKHLAPDRG